MIAKLPLYCIFLIQLHGKSLPFESKVKPSPAVLSCYYMLLSLWNIAPAAILPFLQVTYYLLQNYPSSNNSCIHIKSKGGGVAGGWRPMRKHFACTLTPPTIYYNAHPVQHFTLLLLKQIFKSQLKIREKFIRKIIM